MSCDSWLNIANGLLFVGIAFCVVFTVTYLFMRVVYWLTHEEWPTRS